MELKRKREIHPIFFLICFLIFGFSGTLAFGESTLKTRVSDLQSPKEQGGGVIPIKAEEMKSRTAEKVTKEVLPPRKRVKTQVPDQPALGTGFTQPLRFLHHGRQDKIERQVGPGTPDFVRQRFFPPPPQNNNEKRKSPRPR